MTSKKRRLGHPAPHQSARWLADADPAVRPRDAAVARAIRGALHSRSALGLWCADAAIHREEPGMLRANVPQRLETAWSLRLARAARSQCAASSRWRPEPTQPARTCPRSSAVDRWRRCGARRPPRTHALVARTMPCAPPAGAQPARRSVLRRSFPSPETSRPASPMHSGWPALRSAAPATRRPSAHPAEAADPPGSPPSTRCVLPGGWASRRSMDAIGDHPSSPVRMRV